MTNSFLFFEVLITLQDNGYFEADRPRGQYIDLEFNENKDNLKPDYY